MSSFVRYVLKFKNQDNPYGDVARDILQDTGINKRWGHRTLSRYLYNQGACGRVLEIIDDIAFQYKEMKMIGFSLV